MTHLFILVQWQNSAELSKKAQKQWFFKSLRNFLVQNQSEFHNSTAPSHKNLWGGLLLSIWQTLLETDMNL